LHLFALAQTGGYDCSRDRSLGFYSLLYLTQALGRDNAPDPVQLTVVTNGVQHVVGEEIICPEKATVLGPCNVIPQEYPNISCRTIDVVLPDPGSDEETRLVDQLITEVSANEDGQVLALRGGHRWEQLF